MKVHHLNCTTFCPIGGPLVHGSLDPTRLVGHVLLIESNEGLILVDTGISLMDVQNPIRLGRLARKVTNPILDPEATAYYQIQKLGFKPQDIRHIVPTHLDLDHAGAMCDFPHAKIHVYEPEYQAAMRFSRPFDYIRYRKNQWTHDPIWERYAAQGETWFGFDCVRKLQGIDEEILLVPILGHSEGHCGIAVHTADGWLLHAGDAYFYYGEMDIDQRRCTIGLHLLQNFVAVNNSQRKKSQEKLRKLVREHSKDVHVFCAHDPAEFSRFHHHS